MNAISRARVCLVGVLVIGFTLQLGYAMQECPRWTIVNSPNVANRDNQLSRVAFVSSNDVWAVGNSASSLDERRTLIQHWNGANWSIVPSPNAAERPINWLIGVEAVASNNVWAVGYSAMSQSSSSINRTLILRWNGSTWSIVPSPNPRPHNPALGEYPVSNELFDLAVVSANDIWAVGHSYTFSNGQPLILHWNGVQWSNVPAPDTGDFGRLYSVDAVSANDVWAIGTEYHQGNQDTIIHHWNGQQWNVFPSVDVGPFVQEWRSINARAANDIWAVGYHLEVFGVAQVFQTSIIHFDGTSWSVVPSPNVNQRSNYLWDVAPVAQNNAYAVGFFDTGTAYRTMIQRWNGFNWTITPTPNRSTSWNSLYGVAALSASELWTVGEDFDGLFNFESLIMRFKPCAGG